MVLFDPPRAYERRLATVQKSVRQSNLALATFDRSHFAAIRENWNDLISRSAEDNVYYSPDYAQALLQTVEKNVSVRFATAWNGDRLMAFMPLVLNKLPVPGLRPVGKAWESDYTFGCTPLLDRDDPGHAEHG